MWFKMFNDDKPTVLLMRPKRDWRRAMMGLLFLSAVNWAQAQDTPPSTVCKAFDFRAMAYSINDAQTTKCT